jgi:hypothetical protein
MQFFYIKETSTLSDKEKKLIYCPQELRDSLIEEGISTNEENFSVSLRNFA